MSASVHAVVPLMIMVLNFLGSLKLGDKKRSGWAWCVAAEVVWIPYAFATQQWAFMLGAMFWGVFFFYNWIRWKAVTDDELVPRR